MSELRVYRLGRVEYEDGLALMRLFSEGRRRGLVPDTLLLLEHPPVLTLGRGAKPGNILADPGALAAEGVEVFETNRGGDVTYHGPGQVVGYPLFFLPPGRQDVRRYVRDVERCVIGALADFGLAAGIIPRWPGVWLGQEGAPDARKICAIGVHLSRWYTTHGFALNVNTRLEHFRLIVPCGIREAGVTSMARELGGPVAMGEVEQALARHFARVFEAEAQPGALALRTVSIAVMRGEGERQQVLLARRRPERGGFWQVLTGRQEPGELPAAAAARELLEETGLEARPQPLGYVHAFALGEDIPPRLVEETAFGVRWPAAGREPRCGPEHECFEWVDVPQALTRLPFQGLREAVRRAARQLPGE